MTPDTTSQDFFEKMYRANEDPWNFAASPYELSRYAAIESALGDHRYTRAFEPGCSVGVLTAKLASHCDQVEAMDISPTAVAEARQRCEAFPRVHVHCGALPGDMVEGTFDLIVFSEVGYYFAEERLSGVVELLVGKLRPKGVLLAAHWLGTSPDHLISGDQVHHIIGTSAGLRHEHGERHAGFRLDRWRTLS